MFDYQEGDSSDESDVCEDVAYLSEMCSKNLDVYVIMY